MDIVMPQLGETVTDGKILVWRKKVGDAIAADEVLFELETEKTIMDIPSPMAGRVTAILVAAGETVPVGTKLAVVEEN